MALSCPSNKNFKDLAQSIKDWAEQDINKRNSNIEDLICFDKID